MEKTTSNNTLNRHTLIENLRIMALAFLILVNIAGAMPYAYIAHSDNDVSVIDTATNEVIATVEVGSLPFGVTVTPDEKKAYVTNSNDNTVSVIDTATNAVTTVDVGKNPNGIAVNPEGTKVYVANYLSETVSVVDVATDSVTATVYGLSFPKGVAVSPDGTKAYVTNFIVPGENKVSVIDTTTNTVVDTFNIGINPCGIAINPEGTKIYVTDVVKNIVSVVDLKTKAVATVPVGSYPTGVAVNLDGREVYVANQDSNNVSVIDTATNKVISTVYVGSRPCGVAVSPDGTKVYVTSEQEGSVSIIDTDTNTVTASVKGLDNACSFGQFIGIPPTSKTKKFMLDTNTSLTSSTNQYSVGKSVTLTATVGTMPQATEKPSGTVNFMDGTTLIGTEDVNSGEATLMISSLSAGSHSITAKYSGDINFKSSTSSPFALTVQEPTPEIEHSTSKEDSSAEQNSSVRDIIDIVFENPLISSVVGGLILLFVEMSIKRKS